MLKFSKESRWKSSSAKGDSQKILSQPQSERFPQSIFSQLKNLSLEYIQFFLHPNTLSLRQIMNNHFNKKTAYYQPDDQTSNSHPSLQLPSEYQAETHTTKLGNDQGLCPTEQYMHHLIFLEISKFSFRVRILMI